MAYIPAPGVVEVLQYFSSAGANALNRWHVHSPTPWTYERLQALNDVFDSWESSSGSDNRAAEVACTGFRATDLTSLDSPMAVKGVDTVGGILQPAAPFNSTVAVKLDTGHRGRGRNGRIFWFGLVETGVDAYQIQSLYATNIINSVQALIDAVSGFEDCSLVVLHEQRDGVILNPKEFSAVQRAQMTDFFLDSQRDRLPMHKRKKKHAGPL